MSKKTDEFNLKLFERLFGTDYFNAAYLKGVEEKASQIPFSSGRVDMAPGVQIEVLPKVVEHTPGSSFYVPKGYQATLYQEGKEIVSQFLPIFQSIGFNLEQATELLKGGAVRHISSYLDDRNKTPVYSFSQIDFHAKKTENDNFKVSKVADDGSLLITLGQIGIVAKQPEKQDIYERLQRGERVPVTIARGDDYPRLFIRAAARKTGLGVDLMDATGLVVEQFPQQVVRKMYAVQSQQTTPEVKTPGKEPGKEIPSKTVELVTGDKEKDKKPGQKKAV